MTTQRTGSVSQGDALDPDNASWRLGLGTLLQGLNSSMIAVAIGSISLSFPDASAMPWLVSALYFTAAVGSPTFGHLSDLFGAKRIYDIGLAITLMASILGPLSPNIWILILARALLGLGTSAQSPAAIAMVIHLAKTRHTSSSAAVGVISLLGQVSAAIGPLIGGIVIVAFGWHWIFWINIPLIVNAYLWSRKVPSTSAKDFDVSDASTSTRTARRHGMFPSIDPCGIALFCVALIALIYALLGSSTPLAILGLCVSSICFALFYCQERRAPRPFIDFAFISSHPTVTYVYVRTILVNIAFYIVFYGIPQWLESRQGLNAAQAGLLLFPNFLAGVITTRLASSRLTSFTPPQLRRIGSLLLGGSALMSMLLFHFGMHPLILFATFLLGTPSGFNNMGNQLELNRTVRPQQLGQATGMFRTSQFIGAAISTPLVFHILQINSTVSGGDLLMIAIVAVCIIVCMLDLLHHHLQESRHSSVSKKR
ncbi:MAG: MFS transporter [Bifidobacterium aquikefiri]|uniref:Major facilitator transporter n=1 Tax=Bifidobacterium aquikefiri TaxID=1653207 RepID=A0A261GBW9_9BIFI|nr:MFS transporter [Bifidobacterium aquikefiri]OZG68476.1 major facilitator transporter [Bifidobacterium aquikefiri]